MLCEYTGEVELFHEGEEEKGMEKDEMMIVTDNGHLGKIIINTRNYCNEGRMIQGLPTRVMEYANVAAVPLLIKGHLTVAIVTIKDIRRGDILYMYNGDESFDDTNF